MCVLGLGSRRVSSVMFARECPNPAPDASIEVHLGKNCLRASREKKGGFYAPFSEGRQVEASRLHDVRSTYPVIKATTTVKMS